MSEQPRASEVRIDWRAMLEGSDTRLQRMRGLFRHIPAAPRCKFCSAPYHGVGGRLMRLIDRQPWEKNPNYCRFCFRTLEANHGGAEIDVSMLFADVRGSTGLAEKMSATDFRRLMNRFYDTASRLLIDHDAIVDKFVGDEVVGIFIPGLAGQGHPRNAIDAARALLRETGHGEADGPWIPVGAGVHTGTAYVGSVGEGDVTDFTALGDAVNVTARLASAAGAGEILVTTDAATAAGFAGNGLEQRHLELRGHSAPVDVIVLTEGRGPIAA
jgi:adenylate cyclase